MALGVLKSKGGINDLKGRTVFWRGPRSSESRGPFTAGIKQKKTQVGPAGNRRLLLTGE